VHRASGDQRVEPVEIVESSRAVWQCRHSQNAWARHVEHVESCRAKWNFGFNGL